VLAIIRFICSKMVQKTCFFSKKANMVDFVDILVFIGFWFFFVF